MLNTEKLHHNYKKRILKPQAVLGFDINCLMRKTLFQITFTKSTIESAKTFVRFVE